jgi:predicted nucleic acid-binding Zn ribbon protein
VNGLDPADSPDARSEGPDPSGLPTVIGAYIGKRGWSRRVEGARIHQHWSEIAGEALAQHVVPIRLHGGVLVVKASSPAWATQLRYLAPQLIARANEVLGSGMVASVSITAAGSGHGKNC